MTCSISDVTQRVCDNHRLHKFFLVIPFWLAHGRVREVVKRDTKRIKLQYCVEGQMTCLLGESKKVKKNVSRFWPQLGHGKEREV